MHSEGNLDEQILFCNQSCKQHSKQQRLPQVRRASYESTSLYSSWRSRLGHGDGVISALSCFEIGCNRVLQFPEAGDLSLLFGDIRCRLPSVCFKI